MNAPRHARAARIVSSLLAFLLIATTLLTVPPRIVHADGDTTLTVSLSTSDGGEVPFLSGCLWLASAPNDTGFRRCIATYDPATLVFEAVPTDTYIFRIINGFPYLPVEQTITLTGGSQGISIVLQAPAPTPEPTIEVPTEVVTEEPLPTDTPTDVPLPTEEPTDIPTDVPTEAQSPTATATTAPLPTETPTDVPTDVPTEAPTLVPPTAPTRLSSILIVRTSDGNAIPAGTKVHVANISDNYADVFAMTFASDTLSPYTIDIPQVAQGNVLTVYIAETPSYHYVADAWVVEFQGISHIATLDRLETPTVEPNTATAPPSPSPEPSPTASATVEPSPTATDEPTATPSSTPTSTSTATLEPTETSTATVSPTDTPTATGTSTPTHTPTEAPTVTATATSTATTEPSSTATATATSTATSTATETPTATATATATPSATPTASPTATPTVAPVTPTATLAPPVLLLDGQTTSVVTSTGTTVQAETSNNAELTVWSSVDCTGSGVTFFSQLSLSRLEPAVRSLRARLTADPTVTSACLTVTWLDPTPTATATITPTRTATAAPSATATEFPTETPTISPTATITATPTMTATVTATATPISVTPVVLTLNGQATSITVLIGTPVKPEVQPYGTVIRYWMSSDCTGSGSVYTSGPITLTSPGAISFRAGSGDPDQATTSCLTATWLAPTPTFTVTPTATSTATPTATSTGTATSTATPTVTSSPTASATATIAPSPTRTPTLTVTPTPQPPTGTVSGTGGAGVNCRAGAGTTYGVIVVLREGESVLYRGAAQGGWQPVTCNDRPGWISASYLRANPTPTPAASPTRTPTASTRTPSPTGTAVATATPTRTMPPSSTPTATVGTSTGTVSGTGGAGVNCRTGAGTGFPVITALREGQSVSIRGAMVNGWQPVTCNNQNGFVLGTYLKTTAPVATTTPAVTRTPTVTPAATRTPTPTSPAGQGVVSGTGGLGVNCRSGIGVSNPVIAVLAEGATVPVLGPAQAGWIPVRCGGRDGWISASYLRLTAATLPDSIADRWRWHWGDLASSPSATRYGYLA